jgi:hypothetical protein
VFVALFPSGFDRPARLVHQCGRGGVVHSRRVCVGRGPRGPAPWHRLDRRSGRHGTGRGGLARGGRCLAEPPDGDAFYQTGVSVSLAVDKGPEVETAVAVAAVPLDVDRREGAGGPAGRPRTARPPRANKRGRKPHQHRLTGTGSKIALASCSRRSAIAGGT